MVIQIDNKDRFISQFLNPVSKINNSCVLKLSNKGMSALLSAADNTAILYAQYTVELDTDDISINLPDISRLYRILQCIDKDNISLTLKENYIQYSSSDVRFKYHLLEDGIISIPAVSVDKIKNIQYDTSLSLPYQSIVNLIKSSSFTIDVNKVYISTKDDDVYAEIGNSEAHNVDSISIKMCTGYKGLPISSPLPISLETVRLLLGTRCDIVTAHINSELNVMMFEINNNDIKLTYIISGLIK
jgi:hypothetical protein